ncbi:MAG: hypothetical protein M9894_21130 [Planctomycetes bacterium]|nr:hypothetical protein [Planctomycetota bacterium]
MRIANVVLTSGVCQSVHAPRSQPVVCCWATTRPRRSGLTLRQGAPPTWYIDSAR